jgi:hypothetical protein
MQIKGLTVKEDDSVIVIEACDPAITWSCGVD